MEPLFTPSTLLIPQRITHYTFLRGWSNSFKLRGLLDCGLDAGVLAEVFGGVAPGTGRCGRGWSGAILEEVNIGQGCCFHCLALPERSSRMIGVLSPLAGIPARTARQRASQSSPAGLSTTGLPNRATAVSGMRSWRPKRRAAISPVCTHRLTVRSLTRSILATSAGEYKTSSMLTTPRQVLWPLLPSC